MKGQITQQENMHAIPIADEDTDSGLYYKCLWIDTHMAWQVGQNYELKALT